MQNLKGMGLGLAILAAALIVLAPQDGAAQFGKRGKMRGGGMQGGGMQSDGMQSGGDSSAIGAFAPMRANLEAMRARGFFETGLAPVYPADADCPKMTSPFAASTRSDGSLRSSRFYEGRHGGMDIPAAEGTPLLAIADGTVVHMHDGGDGSGIGGLAVVLQHAPEDTGLGVWTYSEYKHIRELPDLAIGQRVRMGETIAATSNTGTVGGHYGPSGFHHLHMTAFHSTDAAYKIKRMLIPVGGQWMDPMAFYADGQVDSAALRDLPEKRKAVRFAYKTTDGRIVPPEARVIWPYACVPR